jgi:hypothetical protein
MPLVLSFLDFAAPINPMSAPFTASTHPPLQLRLNNFFHILDSMAPSWDGTGSGIEIASAFPPVVVDRLKSLREVHDSIPVAHDNAVVRIVYEATQMARDIILQVVRESILEKEANLPEISATSLKLCGRLSQMVPPNELLDSKDGSYRTMQFSEIVNAGWAFALGGYDSWKLQRGWTDQRCANELNDLLLKALELTEVRRFVEEC